MGSMDRFSSGLRRGTVYHAFCGFSIRTPSLRVSRTGQISGECEDALAGSDMGVCAQRRYHARGGIHWLFRPAHVRCDDNGDVVTATPFGCGLQPIGQMVGNRGGSFLLDCSVKIHCHLFESGIISE